MPNPNEPEEWFLVLKGPFYNFDDDSEEDPELTGVPAALVRRLRELVPQWRSLGLVDDDTVGCYEDGRLRVGVELGDDEAKSSIGFLRVDVSDRDWQAAWVSPTLGIIDPDLAEADPKDASGGVITDERQGVEDVIGWLTAQLHRPIVRYVWRSAGRVVARDWRLTDTGRPLVGSGPPRLIDDPATAHGQVTVRPPAR